MRSVLLLIYKNIRKKYLQSILIGLIIMLSSTVFAAALGVLLNVKSPVEALNKRLNASHDLLALDPEIYDIDKIQAWWQSQESVNGTQMFKYHIYVNRVTVRNLKLDMGIRLTERSENEVTQDKLQIVEGEKKPNPDSGEIWVTTGIATQNKIKPGDILTLSFADREVELKVSAIVVDPQYSSPMINPTRMWLAPGELDVILQNNKDIYYDLGIQYSDYNKSSALLEDFEQYLGAPFIGSIAEYSLREYILTIQYQIVSAVLLVLSIIIVIVSIFIMSYTITNAVLSDYRIIGVLKAQGFSRANMLWTYAGQYSIISLITVPAGIFFSYFVVRGILSSMMKMMGTADLNAALAVPYAVTFIIITAVVTLSALRTAERASGIKPAEAIRYGAPPKIYSKVSGINIVKLKAFSMTIMLGIKQLFSYKRQSAFVLFSLIFTVFIVTFTVNINNSLLNLGENLAYWGFDDSEVQIARLAQNGGISNEELVEKLQQDERIETVVPWFYLDKNIIRSEKDGSAQRIFATVYDGNMDDIGMINIRGRNPIEANEVSIGINTSRKNNKDVGDYIEITINGQKKTFLITGVFQALTNGAEGFRAQRSAIIELDPDFQMYQYSVMLKENVDINKFIVDKNLDFGDKIDIKASSEAMGVILDNIGSNMSFPIKFIAAIFIMVTFITIFNTILINIFEEQKSYGIFRALGITSKQIRLSILYRIAFLTALSLIIGIPLGLILPPKILGLALSGMGVFQFPIIPTAAGTAIGLTLAAAAILLASYLPSRRIVRINPRTLIEE